MKKVVSLLVVVMMLASLSVVAGAEYLPSISTKAAPEIEEESAVIEGIDVSNPEFELIVAAHKIPKDASDAEKAELEKKIVAVKDVIESVKDQATLNAIVNGALEIESSRPAVENVYDTAEDAVACVSDVFFFDVKDEDGKSILASEYVEGETPAVKVWDKIALPKNLMKVVQNVGGTWVEVPVVAVNEDGEAFLEFSYSGVVAFVFNSNAEKG